MRANNHISAVPGSTHTTLGPTCKQANLSLIIASILPPRAINYLQGDKPFPRQPLCRCMAGSGWSERKEWED